MMTALNMMGMGWGSPQIPDPESLSCRKEEASASSSFLIIIFWGPKHPFCSEVSTARSLGYPNKLYINSLCGEWSWHREFHLLLEAARNVSAPSTQSVHILYGDADHHWFLLLWLHAMLRPSLLFWVCICSVSKLVCQCHASAVELMKPFPMWWLCPSFKRNSKFYYTHVCRLIIMDCQKRNVNPFKEISGGGRNSLWLNVDNQRRRWRGPEKALTRPPILWFPDRP